MANFSLRGIDEDIALRLKSEAKRREISVNALILELIREGLGIRRRQPGEMIHRDLDALAGTWGAEDTAAFLAAISDFESVDEGIWGETSSAGHKRLRGVQARRGRGDRNSAPRSGNRNKQHRAG